MAWSWAKTPAPESLKRPIWCNLSRHRHRHRHRPRHRRETLRPPRHSQTRRVFFWIIQQHRRHFRCAVYVCTRIWAWENILAIFLPLFFLNVFSKFLNFKFLFLFLFFFLIYFYLFLCMYVCMLYSVRMYSYMGMTNNCGNFFAFFLFLKIFKNSKKKLNFFGIFFGIFFLEFFFWNFLCMYVRMLYSVRMFSYMGRTNNCGNCFAFFFKLYRVQDKDEGSDDS